MLAVKDKTTTAKEKTTNVLDSLKDMTFDQLVKIKDFFFQQKQGESLERCSTPQNENDAAALGWFGVRTNIAGNAVKALQYKLNEFASPLNGPHLTDTPLCELIDDIFRASASRQHFRLEKTLETIAAIKNPPNIPTKQFPQPTMLTDPSE